MSKGTRRAEARRGWQQWSEAEGRAALKELGRSGMSDAAFARTKGFSTQRLRYWRSRLLTADAVSFVAVSLPIAATTAERARIEVTCGDVEIRVREDLDVEHLARIVVALGAARARRC